MGTTKDSNTDAHGKVRVSKRPGTYLRGVVSLMGLREQAYQDKKSKEETRMRRVGNRIEVEDKKIEETRKNEGSGSQIVKDDEERLTPGREIQV